MPHEDFAQLGVFEHQSPERVAVHFQNLTVLGRDAPNQCSSPAEHVRLACEFAHTMKDDEFIATKQWPDHLQRSPQDDEKQAVGCALLEDDFAPKDSTTLSEWKKSSDLRFR
jgi:hypothetical protein